MSYTGCRILADGIQISNDTLETGLNNNDVIIGPPGAGKTRGYVLPNILQCNESMIVADSKGALCQQVRGILERSGYKVMELNFVDCDSSTVGYNPLRFIRYDAKRGHYKEQDIIKVAACLVPAESKDPFWDQAARMELEMLLGYLLETQPETEHNMKNVMLLLSELGAGGLTNKLLDEYAEIAPPDSAIAMRWKLQRATASADRTQACIQLILAAKMLALDAASPLFSASNQVDFKILGREKAAIFLHISDSDRACDPILALFYSQALQELLTEADQNPTHRLAVPVRLILDDFACNTTIPDFDKIISVIRSREISVSIILQSLSQLESLYGHTRALTILNGCDNLLYLGGQDVETAQFIGFKANKPTSSILNMPLESAWIFSRGRQPGLVRKYDLTAHLRYCELPEYQPEQDEEYSYDEDTPF